MIMTTNNEDKGYLGVYRDCIKSVYLLKRHVRKGRTIILLAFLLSFTVSSAMLWGCSDKNGAPIKTEFEAICRELKVRKNVVEVLQHFKKNAGKEDVREDFDMVRAFCVSRQLAYRPDPNFVDPLLTKSTIRVLLGEPHAESNSGEWVYYFNNDRTWYISLEFKEQTLFYTHYRQILNQKGTGQHK